MSELIKKQMKTNFITASLMLVIFLVVTLSMGQEAQQALSRILEDRSSIIVLALSFATAWFLSGAASSWVKYAGAKKMEKELLKMFANEQN